MKTLTTKSKTQKATGGKSVSEQTTVAELLETSGVPLHVQVWLDRFARGDEYALEKYGTGDDPGVNDTAFLIYDVLEAQHEGESVRKSSEEARDFVEEWLYTLANYYGQHVWNNAEAALAVLPYFLSASGSPMKPEGDAAYVLLRSAVERLTERRAFLRQDAAHEPEKDEEIDGRAAFKLSRLLADPRTPRDVPWHIQFLAADQYLQDFHASLILLTEDTLARFRGIVLARGVVTQALRVWESTRQRPETVTAERLAALIEAPETPPVVRDLLRHVCVTCDTFSAESTGPDTMDFKFGKGDELTPALIRRRLPAMLRKVGEWKLSHWMSHEIEEPAEKGATVTPGVSAWQRAYDAQQRPEPTPNARACQRRRDALRAAGLCVFCGHKPAAPLCAECKGRQSEQRRVQYRAALARLGRTVRPYRRKEVRP